MEMQSPMDLELPCLNPAPFPSPQTHYGGAEEGGIGGGAGVAVDCNTQI